MDLAIVGPRDLEVSDELIHEAILHIKVEPRMIVTGDATGIDECAARYARSIGIIPVRDVADWNYWETQGNRKIAGPKRNARIVAHADIVLAIRNRTTRGTDDLIKQAEAAGKKVYLCEVRMPSEE